MKQSKLSCLFGYHKYTIDVTGKLTSRMFWFSSKMEKHYLCSICKQSEYREYPFPNYKLWIDYDENMQEICWHDNCVQSQERDKEGYWVDV